MNEQLSSPKNAHPQLVALREAYADEDLIIVSEYVGSIYEKNDDDTVTARLKAPEADNWELVATFKPEVFQDAMDRATNPTGYFYFITCYAAEGHEPSSTVHFHEYEPLDDARRELARARGRAVFGRLAES